jgi:hypothetical protein
VQREGAALERIGPPPIHERNFATLDARGAAEIVDERLDLRTRQRGRNSEGDENGDSDWHRRLGLYGGTRPAPGRTQPHPVAPSRTQPHPAAPSRNPVASSDARASDREFRVVGVVEDIAYDGAVEQNTRRFLASGGFSGAEARYDVYFSLAQTPTMVVSIGAATTGDAAALIAPLRQVINTIVPASAVHWTSAMEDEIALEYAPSRFYSVIVVMFSLSALLLTSLGLFALLSHAAALRMSEMGLRLALGATPQSTAALLLRSGMMPLVAGIAGGLVGAAAASRFQQGCCTTSRPSTASRSRRQWWCCWR